ncbi:MAG: sugar ABC transporter permease [Aggregatilineales bacterium]
MEEDIRFDKLWGIAVGIGATLFMGWFIATEFEGLVTFVEYLGRAIAYTPQSLRNMVDYYGAINGGQLGASMLVGAVFGAVMTLFVILNASNMIDKLRVSGISQLIGMAVGVVVYLFGFVLIESFFIALGAMIIVAFFRRDDLRPLVMPETVRRLSQPDALRLMGQAVLFGGIAGGLGSQILGYPMQHCTYNAEVEAIQRQIGYLVTLISALIVLIPLWTWLLRRNRPLNAGTAGFFRGWMLPIAFLLPTLVSLAVFLYYPAMQVATLSLNAQRFRQERFVCLDNYVNLANDSIYQNSFIVTFVLMAAIVTFSMALALSIAILASQKVKGANFYRTLLIWPYALSPVVVGVIFLGLFRQGRTGLINYAIYQLTGETLNWFTDPSLAPWVIIFASVYNALGFNILFYVAGLQNVPKDLLEAAEIDGANRFQRFLRITLPLLSPFTFFLLITNVTYAFYGIYGAVDTLTQGGPPLGLAGQDGGATDVLIFKLYSDAFAPGAQIGAAAAQSIVLFLLVAVITVVQFRYLETRVTYAD